ncbi:MAG: IS4/IS5 family transposase, partial [Leptospiraceae bacterium]|nr:IS4/IS5 family transposase [Leptospiraceae bacterium]
IAIPKDNWITFSKYTTQEMSDFLMELAEKIDLNKIRKKSRGKKKSVSKIKYDSKKPHVSTARLLAKAR